MKTDENDEDETTGICSIKQDNLKSKENIYFNTYIMYIKEKGKWKE